MKGKGKLCFSLPRSVGEGLMPNKMKGLHEDQLRLPRFLPLSVSLAGLCRLRQLANTTLLDLRNLIFFWLRDFCLGDER